MKISSYTLYNATNNISIYALFICPDFEKLFTGVKVQCKAHKTSIQHKAVYEIDPCLQQVLKPVANRSCFQVKF